MPINSGDANCTTGLSKRLFDRWTENQGSGINLGGMNPDQVTTLKNFAFATARAVADQVTSDSGNHFVMCRSPERPMPAAQFRTINYSNRDHDPESLVTVDDINWRYRCPRSGLYLVNAACVVRDVPSGAEALMDLIRGDDHLYRCSVWNAQTDGLSFRGVYGNAIIRASEGDFLRARLWHTSGGDRRLAGTIDNWITIARVGDA